MATLIGSTTSGFFVVTLLVMGFASFMTGQALANTWRPVWQAVFYAVLLGFVDRFLVWGLFDGELLTLTGYLADTAILLAVCLLAYRLTQARRMVTQYPWIYERAGPFAWRTKGGKKSEPFAG